MKKIVVIYHSGTGHTTKMAEAVAKGARSVQNVNVEVIPIENSDIKEGRFKNEEKLTKLDETNAIIFGSPTYMGMVSGQFKCFVDATGGRWMERKWSGKVAGGFTVSGSPSGDKLSTISYLSLLAAQHGMIWVGVDVSGDDDELNRNKLGCYLGAIGQAGMESPEEKPDAGDKATGEHLGKRIAEYI